MDEMKINSAFATKLISKVVSNIVKKKLGYDVRVQLHGIDVSLNEENKTDIHLDATVSLESKDLLHILNITRV